MAPTTQAGSKRLHDETVEDDTAGTSVRDRNKKVRTSIPDPTNKTGYLTDDRCRLLELPPELRNRIYDFASEDLDDLSYAPRVMMKACKAWNERAWKCFGLTQLCKEIRAEYRPLWLCNLSISSSNAWIENFAKTFLSSANGWKNVPKRVQIEWERGKDDIPGEIHDLTHILRMRAYSLTTSFSYVPYRIANDWLLGEDTCWYCIGEMEAEERDEDDFQNPVEDCTCAPSNLDEEDYVSYQYDLISRTSVLHNLIHNDNAAWHRQLLDDKVNVTCILGKQADPITFRILCKDRFCDADTNNDASSHAESAWQLLKTLGLFDLPAQNDMNFVVAFKTETKIKRGSHEMVSSEMREVHITQVKSP